MKLSHVLGFAALWVSASVSFAGPGGTGIRGGGDPGLLKWPQAMQPEDLKRYVLYYVKGLEARIDSLKADTEDEQRALTRLKPLVADGKLRADVEHPDSAYVPRPVDSIELPGQGVVRAATAFGIIGAPIDYEEMILSESPSYVISLMVHEHTRHFTKPYSPTNDDDQAILRFVRKDVEQNLPEWKQDTVRKHALRAHIARMSVDSAISRFKHVWSSPKAMADAEDIVERISLMLRIPVRAWARGDDDRSLEQAAQWQWGIEVSRDQMRKYLAERNIMRFRLNAKQFLRLLHGPGLRIGEILDTKYEIVQFQDRFVVINKIMMMRSFPSEADARAFVGKTPGNDEFHFVP